MRRIALLLLLYVALGLLPGSQRAPSPPNHSQSISATPVPGAVGGTRIGALTLTEAWDLRSANSGFGGLSGMVLTGPRAFLTVSDAGQRSRFMLGAQGQVAGSSITDLPPLDAARARKRYLDAEAVTRDPRMGQTWLALEGIAQIWRFDAAGKRTAQQRNWAMARWPANGGAEALVRLPDRRFVAISERIVRDDLREGLLFSGDPAARRTPFFRFRYDSGGQGSVTDAAALPDGRILILHRKLGLSPLFTTSIAIADPRRLSAGATLTSRPIAVIRTRVLAENFEGLAVEEGSGPVAIWLVSDDNQNRWQRSRLVRFTIDPAALAPTRMPAAK